MTRLIHVPIAAMALAASAQSQTEITIEVDKPRLNAGESCTVTMWASFPTVYFAMCCVETDFLSSVGASGWGDLKLLRLQGPSSTAGAPSPDGIAGIVANQLSWPFPGFTDTTNPIDFWQATYTAPSVVARSFDVVCSTETSLFHIYLEFGSDETESLLASLVEGKAVIAVLGCYADCDGSGELNLFDLLCFQNMFAAGDPYADCDESGALDLFDFLCFQNEFAAGCL